MLFKKHSHDITDYYGELHDMSLPPRKRKAINALLARGNVARAAEDVGITRQTLHRWLKDKDFAHALKEVSGEQLEHSTNRLVALMDEAIQTLADLLKSRSEHQRRLAADSIISHAIKLKDMSDFEIRLLELERRAQDAKQ